MTSHPFQPDDELLSAYIDGELAADELREVEAWIAREPAAQKLVDELRGVSRLVQALPSHSVDAEWSAQLAQRLDRATKQPPTETENSSQASSMPMLPVGRSTRGWWWSAAAIAAAVAVMVYLPQGVENEMASNAPLGKERAAGADLLVADSALETESVPELRSAVPAAAPASDSLDADPSIVAADKPMGESAVEVAESPEEAGRLAASSIGSRRVNNAEEAADDRSISNAETYLIVWAEVPPEALREQQIDRLFVSNGIAVQSRSAEWVVAAEPVRQQIELRNNRFVRSGVSTETLSGGEEVRRAAESSRFSMPPDRVDRRPENPNTAEGSDAEALGEFGGGAGIAGEMEGETILVEASADQIAACLADMHHDTDNYTTVTIEPVQPALVAGQLAETFRQQQNANSTATRTTGVPLSSANRPADGPGIAGAEEKPDNGIAKRYARQSAMTQAGEVQEVEGRQADAEAMPRAQRLNRPSAWYFDNTAPQDANAAYQLRGTTAKGSATKSKLSVTNSDKLEQLNNLNEFIVQQTPVDRTRLQKPQVLTEQQPVQVLFVLRNKRLPSLLRSAPAADATDSEIPTDDSP